MLTKTLTTAAYVIAGLEIAAQKTTAYSRASASAKEITDALPTYTSTWTSSFLISHYFVMYFVAEQTPAAVKQTLSNIGDKAMDLGKKLMAMAIHEAATRLGISDNSVIDLASIGLLDANEDGYIDSEQVLGLAEANAALSFAEVRNLLGCTKVQFAEYLAQGQLALSWQGEDRITFDSAMQLKDKLAEPQLEPQASSFAIKTPPNNGAPQTSGSGGSR